MVITHLRTMIKHISRWTFSFERTYPATPLQRLVQQIPISMCVHSSHYENIISVERLMCQHNRILPYLGIQRANIFVVENSGCPLALIFDLMSLSF